MRALTVTTIASTSGALLFNFTTNGNTELFRERFAGVISDPATLGMLLACVYAVAAFSQVIVGRLIDRIAMKPLYLGVVLSQILLFVIAAQSSGWVLFFCALGFMASVFGAIPFLDAVVVRYVDDRMRSRVAGIRIAISFGVSGVAVYLLGPIVKASSFETLFFAMAVIACCTAFTVTWLPSERRIKDALLAQQ
ncbi:MAG: MFS transporter, partial [Burkholderiaceae bacterium]|nr:MFS transporter [Burkholderiaceae bacterium]